jgi:hypothetical protein
LVFPYSRGERRKLLLLTFNDSIEFRFKYCVHISVAVREFFSYFNVQWRWGRNSLTRRCLTSSVSELTLSRLKDPDTYKHRFVDKVRVKGKKEPVSVHEVFDGDPQPLVTLKQETKASFEEGLCLYYDRKFSESSVQFNRVLQKNPEDKAARIYLERSAHYMVAGVPDDWTGVETLTGK